MGVASQKAGMESMGFVFTSLKLAHYEKNGKIFVLKGFIVTNSSLKPKIGVFSAKNG